MMAHERIFYRDFKDEVLFDNLAWIIDKYKDDYYNMEDIAGLCFECMNKLAELGDRLGFKGNLKNCFVAYILANSENAFSKSAECNGNATGSARLMALHDMEIFKKMVAFDLNEVDEYLGIECFRFVYQYENSNEKNKYFNKRVRDRIIKLAEDIEQAQDAGAILEIVTEFYKNYGVGKIGLHKAFRVVTDNNEVTIKPITNIEHIYLSDLVGYELQKKKLTDNTEAFIEGRRANNVLLFGDSGTGKSSSLKAILNEYYDRGLRMIEIQKHQFGDLFNVIEQIKDRNYKFIIYMDDLSFEEYEIEYKYLKAIIEGGLEKRPDNVLINATSNRRHLVREKFSDKEERRDDLHASDTVQEKLSLSARFGVSIFYVAPNKKEYMNIIKVIAEKYNVKMDKDELFAAANKWELSHGGLSGRTAQQFINYLLGKQDD